MKKQMMMVVGVRDGAHIKRVACGRTRRSGAIKRDHKLRRRGLLLMLEVVVVVMMKVVVERLMMGFCRIVATVVVVAVAVVALLVALQICKFHLVG